MHLVPGSEQSARRPQSPWRDTVIVLLLTLLSIVLSAHFDWSESLYALTRPEERLQLDELPIGMLVLLVGLVWLAWRRNQQASREIRARLAAEHDLERALAANRELAKETLRIQEADRKHLARELHDELGQYLNAIKLDAVSVRDVGADHEKNCLAAAAIIHTVDHLQGIVSRMIAHLRPVALDELGLVAALEHSVEEWRRRLPQLQFVFESRGSFDDLDESTSLGVYRLIQEGLTNVYKHAQATRVTVQVHRSAASDSDEVHVTVTDDGRGIEPGRHPTGYGISGMRERAELAGGTLVIESSPGGGVCLTAHLPVLLARR